MGLEDFSLSQLRAMRKDDVLELIAESRGKTSTETTPKSVDDATKQDYGPLLTQLTSLIKPMITDAIQDLKLQMQKMQSDFAALQAKVAAREMTETVSHGRDDYDGTSPEEDGTPWSEVVDRKKKKSLPDMLRQSVRSALEEEKNKCEVIISRAAESDDDTAFITTLCTTMQSSTKPTHLTRLGKKGNHPRLLKATFPSSFDARTFIAKYEEARKEKIEELPKIRMRSSKTGEERAAFAKSSKLAYKLNDQARQAKLNESYSLRDDGAIWKYTKEEDSAVWKRVRDWSPPTEQAASSPLGK